MINYKISHEFMFNDNIIKMILQCSIETGSDIFKGIMMFKTTKLYNEFDKNFKFALITSEDNIVGFILEKLYYESHQVWTMDTIYIIPSERMKGYCYQTLLEYSKLQKAVIASSTISTILIKINMREDDCLFQPNMDLSNLENLKKTFCNKDKTLNFLTKGLVEHYQSRCHA